MDFVGLKSELILDPLGRGYHDMSDAEVVTDLNVKHREVEAEFVSGQEILEAAAWAEYGALTTEQRQSFGLIAGKDEVLISGPNTQAVLMALFGPGSDTRANLVTLQGPPISRALELGLRGLRETHVQLMRTLSPAPPIE